MSMVCPQCQHTFQQRLSCPACGLRLQFHISSLSGPAVTTGEGRDQWQKTPWGRMFAGLLLAQGLAYGIQQLMTAGFLATGERVDVWTTLWGIVLLHVVQGLGLIIGGSLCGAGQSSGILYGGFVGLINGVIFLIVQRHIGEVLTDVAVYGQPVIHMCFGGLGGLIGRLIWRPSPTWLSEESDKPAPVSRSQISTPFCLLDGPVHWTRVFFGVTVIILGVLWSSTILEWALQTSEGRLGLHSQLQAELVGWEVCAVAILFGAGLAGSCTFNGMKQGLCVGFGAGLVFMGLQFGNPRAILEKTLLMMACIFFLSLAGGWFGSQLLPPVLAARRRSRILEG